MKKIIIVIMFSLIANVSYAATEKVYLKCKYIVTENRSTGILADGFAVGNFGHIILTEILIGKKNTKITVYRPFPDFHSIDQSFNQKVEASVSKRKAEVNGNSYTGSDIYSGTIDGSKLDMIDRYVFTKSNNDWSLKMRNLYRDGDIDINYIAEGKCIVVDKKYYKNIIKKGPTSSDLEF